MIRSVYAFSAVLSLASLAGCNEIPVLACGSEEASRHFQSELDAQSDSGKLWQAISGASQSCTVQTPAQKKIVADAIARWAKLTPVADQRSAYAALPDSATDLRVALLNATEALGMLSEMDGKAGESSPDTAGNAGRKLTLSAAEIASLTAKHKWLSDVLAASEVDGYRIYVARSTKSADSNPDQLLVELPDRNEYRIPLATQLYDPRDKSPLFQVVRIGKEGQQALMIRQLALGANGRLESLTFHQLATGEAIPGSLTRTSDISAASGAATHGLYFLKDDQGNLLYAVGTEGSSPQANESSQICSVSRKYFDFRSDGFGEIRQLAEKKEVDCGALAKGKPITAFSAAEDYKTLSRWNTGMLLGQLVKLDRQDASDEMLLQTIRSKAPSSLLALIQAARPPAKSVRQDLADVSSSLKAVRQSIDHLRWIFRGSPYLQTLNAGLSEPESMLSGLAPAANGIDLTKEDLTRLETYIELRAEVVREFPAGAGFAGEFKHAYEVRDLGKKSPDNLAVVLSDEPMASGQGSRNVLVRDMGVVAAKKAKGGSVEVPRYAVIPKQEGAAWGKYKKYQPQIQEYSAKVNGFYQAVLNRYDQLPQALQTGTYAAFGFPEAPQVIAPAGMADPVAGPAGASGVADGAVPQTDAAAPISDPHPANSAARESKNL